MQEQQIIISSSQKAYNWIFSVIINSLLVFVLFFCTTNTLIDFPIDKVMIVFLLGVIALMKPENPLLNTKELATIVLLFSIAMASSVANITLAPMIYFPVVGLLFAVIIRRHPQLLLSSLYYALMINIVCGLVFDALAFAGVQTDYVSESVKGFSFLYSPHGFTTTVQTFGTLCIIWFILYTLRKKLGMNSYFDKSLFVINTIAILATLNRSTLLFWMIILFFWQHKLFWTIILFVCAFMIRFWNEIIAFITNAGSIIARSQLLQGFDISYVESHSILVYVFGRGTNQLSQEILDKVKWYTRADFENGYAMLLHSYGALGLLVYIILCLSFIFQFIKIKRCAEACILCYYFFVTQYLTQEFVSVSFYFFLAVMFLAYNLYPSNVKLIKNHPATALA